MLYNRFQQKLIWNLISLLSRKSKGRIFWLPKSLHFKGERNRNCRCNDDFIGQLLQCLKRNNVLTKRVLFYLFSFLQPLALSVLVFAILKILSLRASRVLLQYAKLQMFMILGSRCCKCHGRYGLSSGKCCKRYHTSQIIRKKLNSSQVKISAFFSVCYTQPDITVFLHKITLRSETFAKRRFRGF